MDPYSDTQYWLKNLIIIDDDNFHLAWQTERKTSESVGGFVLLVSLPCEGKNCSHEWISG